MAVIPRIGILKDQVRLFSIANRSLHLEMIPRLWYPHWTDRVKVPKVTTGFESETRDMYRALVKDPSHYNPSWRLLLKTLQKPVVVFLLANTACLLWGSAFPSIKIGYTLFQVTSVSSRILFAGIRFFLAGLVTLCYAAFRFKKWPIPDQTLWKPMMALGLVQTFGQYFFSYIGLAHTPGAVASIINGTSSFMILVIAHFLLKDELLTPLKILGCVIGTAGIVVLQLGADTSEALHFFGEAMLLLSTFFGALGTVLVRPLSHRTHPFILTGSQLSFGGFLLMVVGMSRGGTWTPTGLGAYAILFYLVFLSLAAFNIWTLLLKENPVSRIGVYNLTIPIYGTVLSGIFLKETFWEFRTLAALILVSFGVWVVQDSSKKH